MPETSAFTLSLANWSADETAIAELRRAVFIEEQAVPESLEWEMLDAHCVWFVARAPAGELIGIVRLTPDGRIGRMAVRAPWRRRGVGAALLRAVMAEARRRGFAMLRLSAQTQAQPFYEHFGFHAVGEIYADAGIPHIAMTYTFEATP